MRDKKSGRRRMKSKDEKRGSRRREDQEEEEQQEEKKKDRRTSRNKGKHRNRASCLTAAVLASVLFSLVCFLFVPFHQFPSPSSRLAVSVFLK